MVVARLGNEQIAYGFQPGRLRKSVDDILIFSIAVGEAIWAMGRWGAENSVGEKTKVVQRYNRFIQIETSYITEVYGHLPQSVHRSTNPIGLFITFSSIKRNQPH